MNAAITFPVPVDYSNELTYLKTSCADCGVQVTYANTKIVQTPVAGASTFPGVTTSTERRVCWHH